MGNRELQSVGVPRRFRLLGQLVAATLALSVTVFLWTYPVISPFQAVISAILPLRLIQKGTLNHIVPWFVASLMLLFIRHRVIALLLPLIMYMVVLAGSAATAIYASNVFWGAFDFVFVRDLVWRDVRLNSIGFAATTILAFWKTRSRPIHNGCIACGYDLTGNVSGVCPECGKFIRGKIKDNKTDSAR